jgi:hypothetical protein
MPDPTHITVTAPAGRTTPIHTRDGVTIDGTQLQAVAGVIHRVRYSQDVRRSIGRGDLVPCDMDGKECGVDLAAAPDALPEHSIKIRPLAERVAATMADTPPERPFAIAADHAKPKKGI